MSNSRDPSDIEVAKAAALAAFGLSVNTLRFLVQKGILDQDDLDAVVSGILASLERLPEVSEPTIHAARELLSGVAQDLGVSLKKPN